MIIPINERYRIVSDEYQWIIQKKGSRKGKEDWQSRLFFGTFEAAAKELGELLVRRPEANTLVDALQEVEKIATTSSRLLHLRLRGYKTFQRPEPTNDLSVRRFPSSRSKY